MALRIDFEDYAVWMVGWTVFWVFCALVGTMIWSMRVAVNRQQRIETARWLMKHAVQAQRRYGPKVKSEWAWFRHDWKTRHAPKLRRKLAKLRCDMRC
jgi:hypothetical protein